MKRSNNSGDSSKTGLLTNKSAQIVPTDVIDDPLEWIDRIC